MSLRTAEEECAVGERETVLAAYAAGADRLRQALDALPSDRLAVRPGPEKWSAREIALHLCDSEISMVFRMKRAIAEPGSPVPAFDQDRWVEALAAHQDLRLALAAFAALRAEMTAVLRGLPPDAWQRTVIHPQAGAVSLEDWLRRAVLHTQNHLAQIRACGGA